MSYVGCTKTLMAETDLGKVLKPVFDERAIVNMEDLEKMLTKISESSRTAKLRLISFIRPMFTINTQRRRLGLTPSHGRGNVLSA